MASFWMISVFLGLVLLRLPVCAAMGFGALIGLALMGMPLDTLARYMLTSVRSIPLLAIPFFILAATLMNEMGLTRRLFDFATHLVGFMRGGLAQVNIVASLIFAGISGSALADIAGLGSMQIRAMRERGYRPEFSAAVTVSSAMVGPIIPPSIMFIIYAVNMNVSIGHLFVAGLLPGLMIAAILMATVWILAATGIESCPQTQRSNVRSIARAAGRSLPPLLTPVLILYGIIGGFFTATEAAVIAVLYSLLLGALYREMTPRRLLNAFEAAIKTTALIMYLTGIGAVVSFILTSDRVAFMIADHLLSLTDEQWLRLLLINVAVLILGCVLETLPALLIAIPLFGPIAVSMGVDPVHFGVILTLNLLIGIITPPVGLGLFAVAAVAQLRLEPLIRATLVFFPSLILSLLIVTYVPALSTWLPNLVFR